MLEHLVPCFGTAWERLGGVDLLEGCFIGSGLWGFKDLRDLIMFLSLLLVDQDRHSQEVGVEGGQGWGTCCNYFIISQKDYFLKRHEFWLFLIPCLCCSIMDADPWKSGTQWNTSYHNLPWCFITAIDK